MNQMFKFGFTLGLICLLATMVLAVTHRITKPKIEKISRLEEQKALKKVMPEADFFSEKSIGEISYFDAMKGSKLTGYCVRATASGYNGFIRLIVGIDLNGTIKGVEILEHHETPGLGAKINEIKRGEEEPYFLRQFKGKPAKTVALKEDIDAITGATISSKAITDAINKTVGEFLDKVKK